MTVSVRQKRKLILAYPMCIWPILVFNTMQILKQILAIGLLVHWEVFKMSFKVHKHLSQI